MCFNRQIIRDDGASPDNSGGGGGGERVFHCRSTGAAVAR